MTIADCATDPKTPFAVIGTAGSVRVALGVRLNRVGIEGQDVARLTL